MSTGPARVEQLFTLHRALTTEMTRRLKSECNCADLTAARRFLGDQGVALMSTDAKDRKRLEAIRKLYLQRLQEAVESESPSAAILMEVLRFLRAADAVQGLAGQIEARNALAAMTAADLPFA